MSLDVARGTRLYGTVLALARAPARPPVRPSIFENPSVALGVYLEISPEKCKTCKKYLRVFLYVLQLGNY